MTSDHEVGDPRCGGLQNIRCTRRNGCQSEDVEGEFPCQRVPLRGSREHRVTIAFHFNEGCSLGDTLNFADQCARGPNVSPFVAASMDHQQAATSELYERITGLNPGREPEDSDDGLVTSSEERGAASHRMPDHHHRNVAESRPYFVQDAHRVTYRCSLVAVPAPHSKTHCGDDKTLRPPRRVQFADKRSHSQHRELIGLDRTMAANPSTVQDDDYSSDVAVRLVEGDPRSWMIDHTLPSLSKAHRMGWSLASTDGAGPQGEPDVTDARTCYMQRNASTSWRREPVYRPVVAFGIMLFRSLGLRFRVRGAENFPRDGAFIVAITHFGYLDFALTEQVLWKKRRRLMRFMATAASFRHRIAGPLMRGMGHIPVQRGAGDTAFPLALQALAAGEVVGIFPEASVSETWTVKKLKTGTARLAIESGAPIIPVGVWGGHRVITKGRKPSLRRAFRVPIHIEIGSPIYLGPGSQPIRETAALQVVLEKLVARAREGYPIPRGDEPPWWMPVRLEPSEPITSQ